MRQPGARNLPDSLLAGQHGQSDASMDSTVLQLVLALLQKVLPCSTPALQSETSDA